MPVKVSPAWFFAELRGVERITLRVVPAGTVTILGGAGAGALSAFAAPVDSSLVSSAVVEVSSSPAGAHAPANAISNTNAATFQMRISDGLLSECKT